MLADRHRIARLIPHSGAMCLLDGVVEYDAQHIRCVSSTHLDADNPLRAANGLPALCGIEYAAQAMAVHGGMQGAAAGDGGERPRAGYLAGVRDVTCTVSRLDTLGAPLTIDAERLMGDGTNVMYTFRVSADGATILQGRATVVLDAEKART
ncbi:MAG TPA: hotdog family protein [Gallionellaceae bacterium]|nr:hotdog family protein [Gallionellaceae bacterium]